MSIRRTILLAGLVAWPLGAQSPRAVANIGSTMEERNSRCAQDKTERCTLGIVAGNNPWMSWAVSGEASIKSLAGDGKFGEQWMLTAAKITYDVPMDPATLGGMHLPVMANLAAIASGLGNGTKKDSIDAGIKALTSSTDGLNVGIYPYWPLNQWTKSIVPTLFLGASAKLNTFKDTTAKSDQTLLTGRLAAGVEFQVGDVSGGSKPLTLSAAYVHSRFGADAYESVFKERRSTLNSAEFTLILPLASNAGVIAEGIAVADAKPAFRLGLMVAAAKAKDPAPEQPRSGIGGCAEKCSVQITAIEDLGADVNVSETANNTSPKGAMSCALRKDKSYCTFLVDKTKAQKFEVPSGFKIASENGKCLSTSSTTACDLAAGINDKLIVTKAPQ